MIFNENPASLRLELYIILTICIEQELKNDKIA